MYHMKTIQEYIEELDDKLPHEFSSTIKNGKKVSRGYIKITKKELTQAFTDVRAEWLREEIEKLENGKILPFFQGMELVTSKGNLDIWRSHDKALQTIIDRYQKELDEINSKANNK